MRAPGVFNGPLSSILHISILDTQKWAYGQCRGHQWTFTLKMDKKDLEARTGLQVVQLDEDLRALSKKRVSDSFQNGLTYQYFDNAVQVEHRKLVPWLNGGLVCRLHKEKAGMAKIAKNAMFLVKLED